MFYFFLIFVIYNFLEENTTLIGSLKMFVLIVIASAISIIILIILIICYRFRNSQKKSTASNLKTTNGALVMRQNKWHKNNGINLNKNAIIDK